MKSLKPQDNPTEQVLFSPNLLHFTDEKEHLYVTVTLGGMLTLQLEPGLISSNSSQLVHYYTLFLIRTLRLRRVKGWIKLTQLTGRGKTLT